MTPTPKRILVTGASGFIGGHVCEALLNRGARVRAMVRRSSDLTHLARLDVEYAHADLGDAAGLRRACQDMDVVLHTAAAVGSFGEWEHYYETGVLGTQRLIEAAGQSGAGRFVHISSIAVYGFKQHPGQVHEDTPFDLKPQAWNHYVREKVMSEQLQWQAHAERKIQATSIRPVIVIGARDRNALPRLVELLKLPVTALPGSPRLRFPLVCIEDCVDAIVRSVYNDAAIGRAYNVAGEPHITLGDFFTLPTESRIPCMDTKTETRGRPKKLRPELIEASDEDRLAHQQAIGERIRRQRELHGWSTADLAHRTGLTAQGIREVELGQRAPLTWTMYLLGRALDCGAGWLAFGG